MHSRHAPKQSGSGVVVAIARMICEVLHEITSMKGGKLSGFSLAKSEAL